MNLQSPNAAFRVSLLVLIASSLVVWLNLKQRWTDQSLAAQNLTKELRATRHQVEHFETEMHRLKSDREDLMGKIADALTAEAEAATQLLRMAEVSAAVPIQTKLPFRWDDTSPTTRLGKRLLGSLGIRPLSSTEDGEYSIDPVMAEILDLSPGELVAVNSVIHNTTEDFKKLEVGLLELEDEVTDPALAWLNQRDEIDATALWSFRVPEFPVEGAQLRDQFVQALTQTLGPSRTAMFLSLGEGQFEDKFGGFGQTERRLIITERVDPAGTYLNVNVTQSTGSGRYSNVGVGFDIAVIGNIGSHIPESWRHLINGRYTIGQSLETVGGDR